jgi:hypothetical protein
MKWAGLCLVLAGLFASTSFGGHVLRARHWGGMGVELDIGPGMSRIEFDCAHGTISDRFTVDRQGQFDLSGTYFRDGPGPITTPPPGLPAHYVGDIEGGTMHLTVILTDTGETIGPFLLTRGVQGFIVKCL